MTQRKEREALPPQVVEAARKSLVIAVEEAEKALTSFDPDFLPLIKRAVALSETDLQLRAALNRTLFTSRNATFAYACREALEVHKRSAE